MKGERFYVQKVAGGWRVMWDMGRRTVVPYSGVYTDEQEAREAARAHERFRTVDLPKLRRTEGQS